MICKRIIVVSINKLETDDFWYIKYVLVVQYSIDFFPAFFQLCGPNFLSSWICFLQSLEPQIYNTDTGFIKLFVV